MLADICRGFDIAPDCAVRTGFHRENLTLRFTPVRAADRDALLLERLPPRPSRGPTIVYVTLQKTAEEVAAALLRAGLPAFAYHAGLEDERAGPGAGLVSGVDGRGGRGHHRLRHGDRQGGHPLGDPLQPAQEPGEPAQEIGRAGRDGQPALCEILTCTDDLLALQNFAYGDTPDLGAVRSLLEELARSADSPDAMELSLYDLGGRHDIRLLVVRTLLTYLELAGYLEAGTPIYAEYELRPIVPFEQILDRFAGERREFLRGIFALSKKAKIWSRLDLDVASRALQAPRDRLVRALDYLAEQGLLEVRAAGLRHPYRWLRPPEDLDALAQDLHQRTLERETREIARLDQVLTLAAHDGCQTAFLAAHFGEHLPHPCGHCSWCENGGRPAKLFPPAPVHLDEVGLRRAAALRQEIPDLAEPRALARFLTGLPSPRLTRSKLKTHPLFGAFSQVPFAEVLRRVEG